MAHFESMPERPRMRDLLMRFPEKGDATMAKALEGLAARPTG
jgi:hypothetical protein